MTLPEHAAAIRRLSRGASAGARNRRKKPPSFDQVLEPELGLANDVPCLAPLVAMGTLAPYERIAQGAV